MRTVSLFLILMFVGTAFCFQNEVFKKNIVVETNKEKRLEKVIQKLEIMTEPIKTFPVGPHIDAGKAVEWCVNNVDSYNGWSLTGWSKMGLTSDLNPWFLKVGIINGRIEGAEQIGYVEDADWRLFEEWEQRDGGHGVVAGIQFGFLF